MNSNDLASLYEVVPPTLKTVLLGDGYLLPEFEDHDPERLKGFRVALLVSHGSELPEFHVPFSYLRDQSASVEIVSQDWVFNSQEGEASGLITLAQFLAVNVCVKAHKKISEAKIKDYDAIIILGGAWNPILLRTDDRVLNFIREAHKRGTFIASICHGPQVLISSEVFPKGTRATGVEDIRVDLENAGFVVEDKQSVYDTDSNLLTSPNPKPEALKAFCEEIGKYGSRLVRERP